MDSEINKLLVLLAQRKRPHQNGWVSLYPDGDIYQLPLPADQFWCLICDQIYPTSYHQYELYEHGLSHLKEHNLLPFI